MFVARFRTTDVSHELRFAAWHEMTSKALISTAVTSDSVDDFAATVSVLDLGVVQLSTVAYPPLRATRTARLIRGSDPDLYYDAELSGRPVHAIGAHWGFPNATAFSRAFKQAFGVPPGDYRRQHVES
jgi:AraC-like DNA-binding protein